MRTFGVEEELLLVDGSTLQPLPAGDSAADLQGGAAGSGHEVTAEFQQEQIEVACPPQTTLAGQLEAIRAGRALADEAAARVGGRVVALPTAPGAVATHLVPDPRFRRIRDRFGLTATEQLTCGFHVHVQVDSREEGVAVLDRIRGELPVVLALSANSPFWGGIDSGFASYRYQVWGRWPTAGPTDVFGSAEAYDRQRAALLTAEVPLDAGMLYFDARLSEGHPTVEVRVADVCLRPVHAAVVAALVRALVETAARQWRAGAGAPDTSAAVLRAWMWQASRAGVGDRLIDPSTGAPAPVADVVARLLEILRPVLAEHGEEEVETLVHGILREGTGERLQRAAHGQRTDVRDVVAAALEATHQAPAARM